MVIISHHPKFIFIHIPKTCGQTIKNNLPYNISGHCGYYGLKNLETKCWSGGKYRNLYHLQYRDLPEVYPKLELDKYFIFSFVRNPYDRAYSMFIYCKKNLLHETRKIVFTLSIILSFFYLIYLLMTYLYQGRTFTKQNFWIVIVFLWVFILFNTKYIKLLYQLSRCNFNDFMTKYIVSLNKLSPYLVETQADYLEGCQPNFIGREETFHRDFSRLRHMLGLDDKPLNSINIINKRKDNSLYKYIDNFTPLTIKIVNHIYHKDFVRFGYQKLQ